MGGVTKGDKAMKTVSGNSGCRFSRRSFLVSASVLGAASLLSRARMAAAEPSPEVKKIRVVHTPAICLAPEYLAEELLSLEGFSEVEYVTLKHSSTTDLLVENLADIDAFAPPNMLPYLDAGKPLVALAGLHGGCYELFANERVRAIRDLKGKRVAVSSMQGLEYYYVATMVAYVGMDPRKDIKWVDAQSFDGMMDFFIDGKADAFLAFPPQPQNLRAKNVGRVIVNTARRKTVRGSSISAA
jgi:NitT/TauT family transport system substrate-binding protein